MDEASFTRCRDLGQLKIVNLFGYEGLRRVVKSNWRAVDFMVTHGEAVPAASKRYAAKAKKQFLNLIA